MSIQPQYLEYVLEQLGPLGSLRSNRMFGGVGIYSGEIFFALIDDDTLYFKTGQSNVEDYRARNMPRFMPFPDRPEAALGYHQVPVDVIEDAELLFEWARKSVEVAFAAQAKKARPRSKPVRSKARPVPKKKGRKRKAPKKRASVRRAAKKSARNTRRR